ncbi:PhzF family phenazine biosynthesis protein [Streptomyces sp. NPDC050560]|uniref:PhzF family phenazine biosynthesis protein n=1 Tax=Streptomyces sp. NPDC050560 TaxID=3365630 RepID=UPI0037997941
MTTRRPTVDRLRVFCDPRGRHGTPLAVVRDGGAVPGAAEREATAAGLGLWTVFVDDPERGAVDIHAPTARVPFAAHACVGAGWLLDLPELVTPAGEPLARLDGEFSWIEARPEWAPPWTLRQCAAPAELDALTARDGPVYGWAWQDEAAGRIEAREVTPAPEAPGAPDDAVTGTPALLLTAALGRALNIHQGPGGQLLTAPQPEGWIEIGGRVALTHEGDPGH